MKTFVTINLLRKSRCEVRKQARVLWPRDFRVVGTTRNVLAKDRHRSADDEVKRRTFGERCTKTGREFFERGVAELAHRSQKCKHPLGDYAKNVRRVALTDIKTTATFFSLRNSSYFLDLPPYATLDAGIHLIRQRNIDRGYSAATLRENDNGKCICSIRRYTE